MTVSQFELGPWKKKIFCKDASLQEKWQWLECVVSFCLINSDWWEPVEHYILQFWDEIILCVIKELYLRCIWKIIWTQVETFPGWLVGWMNIWTFPERTLMQKPINTLCALLHPTNPTIHNSRSKRIILKGIEQQSQQLFLFLKRFSKIKTQFISNSNRIRSRVSRQQKG